MDSSISLPGIDLDIEDAEYVRTFIELGMVRELERGTFAFTPRLFCEFDSSNTNEDCGYGASFGYQTPASDNDAWWDILVSLEGIGDRTSASLRIARAHQIFDGRGKTTTGFNLTDTGAYELQQGVEVRW